MNTVFLFDSQTATKYDTDLAILLHRLAFLQVSNKKTRKAQKMGYTWVFGSYEAFTKYLPFWDQNKIKRVFTKAVKCGLLVKKRFGRMNFEKSKPNWYRLPINSIELNYWLNQDVFKGISFDNEIGINLFSLEQGKNVQSKEQGKNVRSNLEQGKNVQSKKEDIKKEYLKNIKDDTTIFKNHHPNNFKELLKTNSLENGLCLFFESEGVSKISAQEFTKIWMESGFGIPNSKKGILAFLEKCQKVEKEKLERKKVAPKKESNYASELKECEVLFKKTFGRVLSDLEKNLILKKLENEMPVQKFRYVLQYAKTDFQRNGYLVRNILTEVQKVINKSSSKGGKISISNNKRKPIAPALMQAVLNNPNWNMNSLKNHVA